MRTVKPLGMCTNTNCTVLRVCACTEEETGLREHILNTKLSEKKSLTLWDYPQRKTFASAWNDPFLATSKGTWKISSARTLDSISFPPSLPLEDRGFCPFKYSVLQRVIHTANHSRSQRFRSVTKRSQYKSTVYALAKPRKVRRLRIPP